MRIEVNLDDLEPILERIMHKIIDRLAEENTKLGDRLAYSEAEAAALLGVARHVLRDERLRGNIKARKVGREYRYSRDQLRKFLGK